MNDELVCSHGALTHWLDVAIQILRGFIADVALFGMSLPSSSAEESHKSCAGTYLTGLMRVRSHLDIVSASVEVAPQKDLEEILLSNASELSDVIEFLLWLREIGEARAAGPIQLPCIVMVHMAERASKELDAFVELTDYATRVLKPFVERAQASVAASLREFEERWAAAVAAHPLSPRFH